MKRDSLYSDPPADFDFVESPHVGPELLRKMMEVARSLGHFRRYFSLRRAWLRAAQPETQKRT